MKYLIALVTLISCGVYPNHCMANEYKVFKGDGMSFRYPEDWNEGLSQALTTKAFVRAIPEQAGYAASCNVNVAVVPGIEQFTQEQLNQANHKIHDYKYLSRIKDVMPDVEIIGYRTDSYLAMQPASSIEYTVNAKSHYGSQKNHVLQIMTIRKPNRYVITCRAESMSYENAKDAFELIISSFMISYDYGAH